MSYYDASALGLSGGSGLGTWTQRGLNRRRTRGEAVGDGGHDALVSAEHR
jgi:hypothetical protein